MRGEGWQLPCVCACVSACMRVSVCVRARTPAIPPLPACVGARHARACVCACGLDGTDSVQLARLYGVERARVDGGRPTGCAGLQDIRLDVPFGRYRKVPS